MNARSLVNTLAGSLALALLVVVLAACADDGDDGGAATSTAARATPTSATPANATEPLVANTPPATAPPANATATASGPASTAALSTPAAEPTAVPPTLTATAATAPAPFDPALVTLTLEPVADGFERPLAVTHAGDGSGRIFVVERAGVIKLLDGSVVLDIRDRVGSDSNEQGLLGLAFHPRFSETGWGYVNYTDGNGDTRISRFTFSGNTADPASEYVLIEQNQPESNHNGGMVVFGPDGYLYLGFGDGGGAYDEHGEIGNGQALDTLLGKVLRIDVDGGEPYGIPPSNPFVDVAGARPEIWAYGIRNPWRFTFDRATGELWLPDVGQNTWEELNLQPAGSAGGENYGWRIMEGLHCVDGDDACDPAAFVQPIAEYGHDEGCSITGGYVYRGAAHPSLQGAYLFGDYCSARIWTLWRDASGSWQRTEMLAIRDGAISSFGEDEAGELYVTDLANGIIYRVGTSD